MFVTLGFVFGLVCLCVVNGKGHRRIGQQKVNKERIIGHDLTPFFSGDGDEIVTVIIGVLVL